MENSNIKAILGPMRLPFLVLTPACVLLGTATAAYSGVSIHWGYFILILIGAIAAHISVNALNEYDDFKSGLDLKTQRTPFSGGSGTLPELPEKAGYALATGLVALAVTAAVGLFFLYIRGLWLLPLGLAGLIIIVAYTRWFTKSVFFCLIVPGLGFGVLMVMGTDFALTGQYSWTAFCASLVPFFLVSDLLLLNQYPDVAADQSIGRKHLLIVAGKRTGMITYAAFLALAYLSVVVGVLLGVLPVWGLFALITIVIAVPAVMGASRNMDDIPKMIPAMGLNVVINILTPVLLAIGLFLAS